MRQREQAYTLWFRGKSGSWFPAAFCPTYAAALKFATAAEGDWLVLPAGSEPDPSDCGRPQNARKRPAVAL
jgi:hypothetical protein